MENHLKFLRWNLESFFITKWICRLYQSIKILFAMAVMLSYAIQFYAAIDLTRTKIAEKFKGNDRKIFWLELVARVGMVLFTCKSSIDVHQCKLWRLVSTNTSIIFSIKQVLTYLTIFLSRISLSTTINDKMEILWYFFLDIASDIRITQKCVQ